MGRTLASFITVLTVTAALALPSPGKAIWTPVNVTHMKGIRSMGNSGFITISPLTFNTAVYHATNNPLGTGCANVDHIYVPDAMWSGIQSVALAALISGHTVDVSVNGCSQGYPVLTMLVIH